MYEPSLTTFKQPVEQVSKCILYSYLNIKLYNYKKHKIFKAHKEDASSKINLMGYFDKD